MLRLYDVKWSANGTRKVLADSEDEARETVENMLLVGSNDAELVELGDCYPKAESVMLVAPPAKRKKESGEGSTMPKVVFVLVWQDEQGMAVEAHASEQSALDSASSFAPADVTFADTDALNAYMETYTISGGIYPREVAGSQ